MRGYQKLRRLLMLAVAPLALAGLSRDQLPRWRTLATPPPMPKPLESGMAPVNGIAMYYAIYGHGPPLLLIHGGLSNADVWSSEIPGLTTHREVIVEDSRGHGRSTRTDERFTSTEPHFTRQQLASIKVRTAIVIGDHDNAVRRSHTLYLANIIPGARLIILPDASHFCALARSNDLCPERTGFHGRRHEFRRNGPATLRAYEGTMMGARPAHLPVRPGRVTLTKAPPYTLPPE